MSVTLLRPYQGFATGAVVTLPNDTESALIAQGLATLKDADSLTSLPGGALQLQTLGGNVSVQTTQGFSTPGTVQAPSILPNVPLGGTALTAFDTNGRVSVAGTWYIAEIHVPATMLVTGVGVLNGTTVGTDKWCAALYGADGTLLRNSATAGTTTAGASAFQSLAFTSTIVLTPGKYHIAVQCNGTTDTMRRLLSTVNPNVLCAAVAGTFGTVPSTITVPTSHSSTNGPIATLYT